MTDIEVLLAPAKLTLSLRVTGVRHDGLHTIDAEMVTLDLADRLSIAPGPTTLTVTGPAASDDVPTDGDNLVVAALRLAERSAAVELTKVVPSGAGLGGGSADAGAVLRWAGFDDAPAAAALGADVPFCVHGGRARVTGIGEVVAPLPHADRTVTLVTPPLHVDTGAVYRRWDALGGPVGDGTNDLEPAAVAEVPVLGLWRDAIEEATGTAPSLAGSGATWWLEGGHRTALAAARWPAGPPPRLVAEARTVPAGWLGPPPPLTDPLPRPEPG